MLFRLVVNVNAVGCAVTHTEPIVGAAYLQHSLHRTTLECTQYANGFDYAASRLKIVLVAAASVNYDTNVHTWNAAGIYVHKQC